MRLPHMMILMLVVAMVGACGSRDREVTLTRIKNTGNGPDEFAILPGKPLQDPESYANLPAPAPGSTNRADQTPKADSIAALGGNPQAASASSARASESALLAHTRRYGAQSGIRQLLAAEDRETRRRHGRVNILNIGPNDDYAKAYKRQWLDARTELERLRRRDVLTPAAPPPED
ncbi:MAG: DUF3035 domain-containing protein [Roseovarius sp.]|nr:DUF3035 domain-containing protein [Roseovarius sp.]